MANQVICDDCGEPIDETVAYYTFSGSKVQLKTTDDGQPPAPPVLMTVEPARKLDYHAEHLPGGISTG
jgi:hypothetical protein